MNDVRHSHHPLAGKLLSCLDFVNLNKLIIQVNCYDCGAFVSVASQGGAGLRGSLSNWDKFYCPGCGRVSPMPQADGKFCVAPEGDKS